MDAILKTYQLPQETVTSLIDPKVDWVEGNMRLSLNYSGATSSSFPYRVTIDPKSGNYGFKSGGKHDELSNFFTILKYSLTLTFDDSIVKDVRIRLYTSENVPECDIMNIGNLGSGKLAGSVIARPERANSIYSSFNNFKIILEVYSSYNLSFKLSGSANLVCFNAPSLISLR